MPHRVLAIRPATCLTRQLSGVPQFLATTCISIWSLLLSVIITIDMRIYDATRDFLLSLVLIASGANLASLIISVAFEAAVSNQSPTLGTLVTSLVGVCLLFLVAVLTLLASVVVSTFHCRHAIGLYLQVTALVVATAANAVLLASSISRVVQASLLATDRGLIAFTILELVGTCFQCCSIIFYWCFAIGTALAIKRGGAPNWVDRPPQEIEVAA